MKLLKTEPFTHKGAEYELRLFSDGWFFKVQAFRNGQEANGYSYNVTLPTAFDLSRAGTADAIQVLFESARNDIRENNWERYVDAHIASLNLKEDEDAACQKCTSREIQIRKVDGRKMYRCTDCGDIWYENRGMTGGAEVILDDITADVIKQGFHDIDASILLNIPFSERERGPSFQDQLKNWCNLNYLDYSTFYQEDRDGNDRQMIHFARKRP
jgi:hypothetical protein